MPGDCRVVCPEPGSPRVTPHAAYPAATRRGTTLSAVEEILADLPIGQLASQLGVDEATAESAARQAIPALLGGLQANAEDPAGAASLAGALGDHSADLLDGGVDLGQVDTGDGEKIVSNIFGPNTDQVAQTLGGAVGGSQAGGQGDLMKRLLPILAPIVLAYLSKKVAGGKYGDLLGPLIAGASGGSGANVLTDILGKMLGRGGAAENQPASAPDPAPTEPAESHEPSILDILTGMLGRGRR